MRADLSTEIKFVLSLWEDRIKSMKNPAKHFEKKSAAETKAV